MFSSKDTIQYPINTFIFYFKLLNYKITIKHQRKMGCLLKPRISINEKDQLIEDRSRGR